jgi:hypothetical protein
MSSPVISLYDLPPKLVKDYTQVIAVCLADHHRKKSYLKQVYP